MARTYGKVLSSIWRDDDFKRLPNAETQLLYLALVSQPDVSPCGRLTVALGRWADGMAGATRSSVMAALEALEAARFIVIDWENDELLIRSFIRHDNGLGNPRRRAAIKNAAQEVGSPVLRASLRAENPGVFGDMDEVIHRDHTESVDSGETPGHSSNVQRTSAEPTVCTAMPNQGTVNREPGTVNREPESVIRELDTQSSSRSSRGGRTARTTTEGIDLPKLDIVLGLLADRQTANAGTTPVAPDRYRGKVMNTLLRQHGQRIRDYLADHPTLPPAACADALATEIA